MTKLLFIQACPRGKQSKSIQPAQIYLDALKTHARVGHHRKEQDNEPSYGRGRNPWRDA